MSEYYETTADKFVFKVKKGLLYSKQEVWVAKEGDTLRVGVTDFAQRRGGDIVFAEISKKGAHVKRGEPFGSYETVKVVQDILSPVDGVITEINPIIDSMPEIINKDPYESGWLAVMKSESGVEGLLSAEEYFELMKVKVAEELKKIRGM